MRTPAALTRLYYARRHHKGISEVSRTILVLALAALAFAIFLLTGCTVQQPKPAPVPVAEVAIVPPPVAPEPVVHAPVVEPPRPPMRTSQRLPVTGPGSRIIVFEPGKKITLGCPEFGSLVIKLPAGEKILNVSNPANGEWAVEKAVMGVDLPIGVVVIDRVPFAPVAELKVITDADVYQFILVPKAGGVSKEQASVFTVINRETEARQAEAQQRQAETAEYERRAYEIRAPQLDAATARVYTVGGDRVVWGPVKVEGDHRQTVIELPPHTGSDLPMVSVVEYGKEMRVNTRTLPEENGIGPRIVVDQPFTEAKLIGSGGTVSIIGRGN